MKKIKKREWIAYLGYFLVWLAAALVLLGLRSWRESLFFLLPLPFTPLVYFSFLLALRMRKDAPLVISTFLRLLLLFALILSPAAIWYFLPSLHESVNVFYLLVSPAEVLSVYLLAILFLILDRRFQE